MSVSARVCTNVLPGNMTLSEADKSREICAMCWEHQSKDQVSKSELTIACSPSPDKIWTEQKC